MKPARSFASDNNAGVHPEVLKAIAAANQGHAVAYGDDPQTEIRNPEIQTALRCGYQSFHCFQRNRGELSEPQSPDQFLQRRNLRRVCSHLYRRMCAPEKFTGCKLIPLPTREGKLTVEAATLITASATLTTSNRA